MDVKWTPVVRYKTDGRRSHPQRDAEGPSCCCTLPIITELSPRFSLSLSLVLALVVCHAHDAPQPATEVRFDTNRTSRQDSLVRDCSDLPYGSSSGIYLIYPDLVTPTPAYCDMSDGEGWTVFQRRADITPRRDFYLAWGEYLWGFGRLDGEFWWGLHHLSQLTSQLDREYELRVDLWDWDHQTA